VIGIEVVYALPDRQRIYRVRVPEGATVREAIAASAVLEDHPGLDLAAHRVGIFGKIATPDRILRAGDRVEIYRPLEADPKDARRRRARTR
jgi:putative ubiquitin-RnfH superfamily antitoxin RatB of RatAB toxin-antitoxin module